MRAPIVLLLLFAVCTSASSQSPSIRERGKTQQQTKQTQENAKQDQRGTSDVPLVVKIAPEPNADKKAAREESQYEEKAKLDTALVNFNSDLAYYTKVLAWVAAFQFAALVVQAIFLLLTLRSSEKSSERQLRAYISATPEHIFRELRMRCAVENHGQTPAYRVVAVSCATDILPFPLPPNYQFAEVIHPMTRTYSLAPGQKMFIGTRGPRRHVEQDEIRRAIINDGLRIYMYGIIQYRDAFGVLRKTEFCRSVVGSPNLLTALRAPVEGEPDPDEVEIEYEIDQQHNDAN